jgi:hypothetical protein
MKKSYMDKSNNDSSNMKLILSNYYSLVKHTENTKNTENTKPRHIPINNVILTRYGERDYAHFATTYHIDYNKPAFYRNLSRLSRM